MTIPTLPVSVRQQRNDVTVSASGRVMGNEVLGSKGTGKTFLLSDIAYQDLSKGLPQVLFDGLGTLTPALLFRLSRFLRRVPPALHKRYWERLCYVDVGSKDTVVPFPIYYQTGAESLREVSERLLTVLRLANPGLVTQAPISWPQMRRVGVNTGIVLTSLGYQLTEAEDLLFHTSEWEHSGRFAEAIKRSPEAAPAVSYFRDHYLPLSRAEKNRLTASFLDHVFPFIVDPSLRAVFCSSTPGIDWQTVEKRGQTVILDFRNVIDPETKRFSMLWIFLSLYEFLKQRGRKDFPFVVTIDEFAALTQQVTGGVNPLAVLLDEFINQYMRNNNIWLTVAHQSIYQVDEQLRHTLLSLGNYVFGRVAKMDEARVLADALFAHDPYRVKRYHNVWGHADVPPISLGNVILNDDAGYFVLERVPEYMQLSEQLELSAQKLTRLGMFEFLLRPATREGEVSQSIIPISIADYLRDTENGELQFPDQAWVNRYRASLAARSGIPVATILREQEQRLMQGTIQEQQGHVPLAGEPVVIAVPMPDVAHPVPQNARETPSLPTLDEQQMAMLSFLIANPDTPVSQLAKELRVGAAQGTEIRESLKAQGLLAELEVRTGRIGAGRPTKFVIPTFAALELFGKDPPSGRGGVIHRSLQHTVMEGAIAKGYSAYCEKDLGNGGIVDVHLEKGTVRIAVEIAIASRPELELSHIKHCLSFGYDQVFGLFADENLLERAAQLLGERFSEQEAGKVRLLPLRKLSHVGQDNGTSSLANNLSLNK